MYIDGKRLMHSVIVAVFAAVFIFILLAVVSEAASDSDAISVTFDPNGGTVTYNDSPTSDNYVTDTTGNGRRTKLLIPDLGVENTTGYVYSKEGYYLGGWARSSTAKSPDYTTGNVTVGNNAQSRIYAVWMPIVTFEPGNGYLKVDGVESTDYYVGVTSYSNNRYRLVIQSNEFTSDSKHYLYYKPGYNFLGWSTDRNATVATYTPSSNPQSIGNTPPSTLYAVWSPCTVEFNENGGSVSYQSGRYYADLNNLNVYGSDFTVNGTHYTYTKTNYTLVGWAEGTNATIPLYVEGDTLPVPDEDYTLYAVWKKTVTVTFDPNTGGSADPSVYAPKIYADMKIPGNTFTVGTTEYKYTKTGYTFLGWSTNRNATEADYIYGDTLTLPANNTTLYAIWKEGKKIIFDPNGGTVTNGESGHDRYEAVCGNGPVYVPGSSFSFDGTQYIYSRDGYTFLGWSQDRFATSPQYINGSILPPTDTGYVIYAVWKVKSNVVTFVYNETYVAEVEVDYGYTFDSGAYMEYAPQGMEEFKIVGWSTEPVYYLSSEGAYAIPNTAETYSRMILLPSLTDLTLYPIWAKKLIHDPTNGLTVDSKDGCYYITATATTGGIVVRGGSPMIFIDNVDLDFTRYTKSPFVLENGADVTLVVMSQCTFKGAQNQQQRDNSNRTYYIGYAGINVKAGTTLTISKDSIGKLTARGGDAKSEYNYGDTDNYRARSGAGIGANGAPSYNSYPYDSGCGSIIIEGGTVGAYGGDTIVIISYNSGNTYVVAAQGIGGTIDDANGVIRITGGHVTVANGHVKGKNGDSNPLINDNQYDQNRHRIFIKPIYAGQGSGYDAKIDIDSGDAVIIIIDENGGTSTTGNPVTIYFDVGNSTIGNALSVTIDDTVTIDVGGMEISTGTTMVVDRSEISENSTVILVTQVGNFFEGEARWDSRNNYYKVSLSMTTDSTPHGTVEVYANEVLMRGGENFGSINPYQSFTIAGSRGVSTILYTFTLNLNDGYEYDCVEYQIDGDWEEHKISKARGESALGGDGAWTITLEFEVSTGGAGTPNYVSFTIVKTKVNVNINNTYSEREQITYPDGIVVPLTDPNGIQWGEGNVTGVHRVNFKESMTYTVNVARSGQNPLNIDWIKVNGVTIPFEYEGGSLYTFTVNDIGDEMTVEIRYVPTIKVMCFDPILTTCRDQNIVVMNLDSKGDPGFMRGIDRIDGRYFYYAYVNKGTQAYFKVCANPQLGITEEQAWTDDYNAHLGISVVKVTIGNKTTELNLVVDNHYATGIVNEETVVEVTITGIRWDMKFTSAASTGLYAGYPVPWETDLQEPTYEFVLGKAYVLDISSKNAIFQFSTNFKAYDIDGNESLTLTVSVTDVDNIGLQADGRYHLHATFTVTGSGTLSYISNNSLEFNAYIPATYYMTWVLDGTRFTMPLEEQLPNVPLYGKRGYELLKWHIQEYYTTGVIDSEYDLSPGDTIPIQAHMIITAVWSESPRHYKINYVLGDGGVTDHRDYYTVDEAYTVDDTQSGHTTRTGYTFKGWIYEGQSESQAKKTIVIPFNSVGEVTIIAVWEPLPIEVTLHDPNHPNDDVTMYFDFGTPYSLKLPVYSNYTDSGTSYTFAGWGLSIDQQGVVGDRITNTTVVSNPNPHTIYVLWVDGQMYIVNITNDGSYGGTVTANVYGTPGTSIAVNISPYRGFKATKITIDKVSSTETVVFDPPHTTSFTYYIPTQQGSGIFYYSITVTFEESEYEAISKPRGNVYIYDGTQKTGVEPGRGYTIISGNTEIDANPEGHLYEAIARLDSGFIWEDGSDADYAVEWEIKKRDAYIIAISESMVYSTSGWSIPDTKYTYVSFVQRDMGEGGVVIFSTAYEGESRITEPGEYPNNVTFRDGSGNYNITIIKGTFIYVKLNSSSIIIELTEHTVTQSSVSPSYPVTNSTEPGNVMANIPSVGRRYGL